MVVMIFSEWRSTVAAMGMASRLGLISSTIAPGTVEPRYLELAYFQLPLISK